MPKHRAPKGNKGPKPLPKSAAEEEAMIERDAWAVQEWLLGNSRVIITPDGWFRDGVLIRKPAQVRYPIVSESEKELS